MKSALINNGLTGLVDLAPVLTPETLSTLIKDKNAAGKIGSVGHPQVFGNHTIQLAQDDGSAILIAPGYKEPINSRTNPELYETVLGEAVESGPTMTAEANALGRQEERRYAALTEADTYFLEAGNGIADARRARDETQAIIDSMTEDENGNVKLDTGLISGFLMKWGGIGSQELGELSALEIEQVLQNLQITKLTPVSNEEIKLVSQMWANAMTGREVNLGRLNVAMRRMQHNMQNLERSGQSRIDLLRNTGSGTEADRYQAQWDEITQSETSTALEHRSVNEYDTDKGPVRTQQNTPYVPVPTLDSIMGTPSRRTGS